MGVNLRQLLAHLRIVRVLFELFYIRGGELARLDFLRAQKFRGVQQADVFHAFRHGQRLSVMLREDDFFRLAQMRQPLLGAQGNFCAGKARDNFLQRRARRVNVHGLFQMPVRQLRERRDHLPVGRVRQIAKMIQRVFRAGHVVHVLGLDVGEQHDALEVRGEFRKLLADGDDGLQRAVGFSLCQRERISWLRHRRFAAAVIKRTAPAANHFKQTVPPENDYHKTQTHG